MDFQQQPQPETATEQTPVQNQQMPEVPAPNPTLNQENTSAPPGSDNQAPASESAQTPYNNNGDGRIPYQYQPPYGIEGRTPYQNQQNGQASYGNSGGQPYQSQQNQQNQQGSYGNNGGQPYQNRQNQQNQQGSYGNSGGQPYQNQQNQAPSPYGSHYGQPYRNNMPYQNGNQYNNGNNPDNNPYGYQNNYPYYNRNAYQLPAAEPGGNLANAAMILGILSIISCFTFTVYPAFILGSIAILLALLSKGSRPKLFSKAKTGIICAAAGLIANTVLVTSVVVLLFTSQEFRDEINQTFEKQYGVTFDEMMDEILDENGLSD